MPGQAPMAELQRERISMHCWPESIFLPGHNSRVCIGQFMVAGGGSMSELSTQGGTGPSDSPGLPLLRTSKILIVAGHAPVQWHQCTASDWYGLRLYRVKSLRPGSPGGAVLACFHRMATGMSHCPPALWSFSHTVMSIDPLASCHQHKS